MALNNELDSHWKKVDKAFEKIAGSGVLPVKVGDTLVSEEGLRKTISDLRSKLYTIAVCGDVKAGKSTLLNALLFGNSVLPVFDTPMTAKLTFIRHAWGNQRYEVEFYDKEEWLAIEQEYKEDKSKWHEWNLAQQKCAEQGVFKNAFITSPRRGNHVGRDFDELPEYLSNMVTGKGWKYTPFVKSVTIYIDHPALENLQLVDTPGLNDSNIINSRETTNWVLEAHALVYILNREGVRQPDIEFFKTYFPSGAVQSRVFVQNQIDIVDDFKGVVASIRELGMREEYKKMHLFGKDETICSYSGLSVLIQKKLSKGIKISKDEEDKVEEFGLDTFPGDPDELEKRLADKLFQAGGKVRIDTACGRLKEVYPTALLARERELGECENELKDCNRSEKGLSEEVAKHKEIKGRLAQKYEDEQDAFDTALQMAKGQIEMELNEAEKTLLEEIKKTVRFCKGSPRAVEGQLPCALHVAKQEAFRKVKRTARKIKTDVVNRLKDVQQELLSCYKDNGIEDQILVPFVSMDIARRVDEAIDKMGVDGKKLYDTLPNWFMRLVWYNLEDLVGIVIKEVSPIVKTYVRECKDKLEDMFSEAFEGQFKRICSGFIEHSENRIRQLEKAKEKLSGAKERRNELEKRRMKLNEDIERLEIQAGEIEQILESDV